MALLEIALVSTIAVNFGTADATVAAALLLLIWSRYALARALRPVPHWRSALRTVLVSISVIWACILLFAPLLDLLKLPRPDAAGLEQQIRGNVAALVLTLIWIWTAVAFGEEMLGRVFLIERFEALLRGLPGETALAVLGAAVLFGLAHGYQGAGGVLLTGTIGVILGFIYVHQERRIWVNVVVHGAVDTIAVLLLFFGVRFV